MSFYTIRKSFYSFYAFPVLIIGKEFMEVFIKDASHASLNAFPQRCSCIASFYLFTLWTGTLKN